MSSKKKKLMNCILRRANEGCGCAKPKLSDVFQPKPKTINTNSTVSCVDHKYDLDLPSSSTASWDVGDRDHFINDREEDQTNSSTFSLNISVAASSSHSCETKTRMVSPSIKMRGSVAVVKDSEDPYADFRQSMLQMIVERGMESRDELRELLSFYLQLNSPSHHQMIIEAFMEIWNGVVSASPTSAKPSKSQQKRV